MVVVAKENKVGKVNKRFKILDGVARNSFPEKMTFSLQPEKGEKGKYIWGKNTPG